MINSIKSLFVALVFIYSVTSFAEPADYEPIMVDGKPLEYSCALAMVYAQKYMTMRQESESLMLALEGVQGIKAFPDVDKDKITKIVIEAYESPLFLTEENKSIAIDEFMNKVFLSCIKAK